jgi:2-polyprenyl-6-methoxyphenol hydroxylase-like FAD-dependent oxidoreductase
MQNVVSASPTKVVIVGGGIGGLTTALALLRRGIDVDVYEQSAVLKEVGAGVQLGSNGTRVLYALGLQDALSRVQVVPSAREIRHWRAAVRLTITTLAITLYFQSFQKFLNRSGAISV